ncbi:MAG: hypothetical protein ISS29_06200 [Candidatus Marinimicrobia bacterium]|nr:hypothetical protein [Candidatus Neomarinimicrobiota bacterium]
MNVLDRAFIHKLVKLVLTILMGIISFFVFILLFWSILLKGPVFIAFSAIMLAVFLPIKLGNRQYTITRIIIGIAALVIILMFSDHLIREINKCVDEWDYTLGKHGVAGYSFFDKLSIYNTNLVISFYGRLFGAPEYGKQSLGLCIKTRNDREWFSDFAMKSPKVTGVIKNWKTLLRRQKKNVSRLMLPSRKISWRNYVDDRRVALALNPVILEAKACPVGDRWRLDCKAKLLVKYRKNAKRVLLTTGREPLVLAEGPFWALQQEGWLFPYTAVWTWSIYSDDKRLSR